MLNSIAQNLAEIDGALQLALQQAGRSASSCQLIAVSKRQPLSAIIEAAEAGQCQFGENYLQEAQAKILAIQKMPEIPPLQWHYIGALQSNKAHRVAELFDWVHTIDRFKLAQRLSHHCPEGKRLQVCLQVNIDEDPNKAGVMPDNAISLFKACQPLPNIDLRGLMTIGNPGKDAKAGFVKLAALFDQLKPLAGPTWNTLSMGMSADFQEAIQAGATLIRVGTALFGPRPT